MGQTGKDYAIQMDAQAANESSFKRLFTDKENPGIFYFRCVNPKYKTNEKVQRDRVIRLARASWVSRPPPRAAGARLSGQHRQPLDLHQRLGVDEALHLDERHRRVVPHAAVSP